MNKIALVKTNDAKMKLNVKPTVDCNNSVCKTAHISAVYVELSKMSLEIERVLLQ